MFGPHVNGYTGWDWQHISRWNPRAATLLDPPEGIAATWKSKAARTFLLGRPYVPDNESAARIWESPLGAAGWAAGIIAAARPRNPQIDAWVVVNEPGLQLSPEGLAKLAVFDVEYARLLRQMGTRAGIGTFSVGNFQVPNLDGGAAASAYLPALRAANDLGAVLCIHQYGGVPAEQVPDPSFHVLRWNRLILPWYRDRLRKEGKQLPPILVSEVGCDMGVYHNWTGPAGWRENYSKVYGEQAAARYIESLRVVAAMYASEPEIIGATIFCLGSNGGWESFRIDELLPTLAATPWPEPAARPTPTPTPPPDKGETMSTILANLRKHWARVEDLTGTLRTHRTLRYPSRALNIIRTYAYHHTGPSTRRSTTWEAIAGYHIIADPDRDKSPWPGIGYHIGIQTRSDGVWVSLLNPLELITNNVKDGNNPVVGVCVMGNLIAGQDGAPTSGELEALRAVTAALDETLAGIVPSLPRLAAHLSLVPPKHTECPGLLEGHVSALRVKVQPVPTPAPVPTPTPTPSIHGATLITNPAQRAAVLAAVEFYRKVQINPDTALMTYIRTLNERPSWVVVTGEEPFSWDGKPYVLQGLEATGSGYVRGILYDPVAGKVSLYAQRARGEIVAPTPVTPPPPLPPVPPAPTPVTPRPVPVTRAFDVTGVERDLAWAVLVYGIELNRAVTSPGGSVWRIVALHEREGPSVQIATALDQGGAPRSGVTVVRYWPDAPPLNLPFTPVLPWTSNGVFPPEGTNLEGNTGYGLGGGDYIRGPGQGVSGLWVADRSYPSDRIGKLGMIAGTEHRRLDVTFQLVTA